MKPFKFSIILIIFVLNIFFVSAQTVNSNNVKTINFDSEKIAFQEKLGDYSLITDPMIKTKDNFNSFISLYAKKNVKLYNDNLNLDDDLKFQINFKPFKPDPNRGKIWFIYAVISNGDYVWHNEFATPEDLFNHVYSMPAQNISIILFVYYYNKNPFLDQDVYSIIGTELTPDQIKDSKGVIYLDDRDSIELVDDTTKYTTYDYIEPQFFISNSKWGLKLGMGWLNHFACRPKLFVKDLDFTDHVSEFWSYSEVLEQEVSCSLSKNFFLFELKYEPPYKENSNYYVNPDLFQENEVSFNDPFSFLNYYGRCIGGLGCVIYPECHYLNYFVLKRYTDPSLEIPFYPWGYFQIFTNRFESGYTSFNFMEEYDPRSIIDIPNKLTFYKEPFSLVVKNLRWTGDPKKNLVGLVKSDFDVQINDPNNYYIITEEYVEVELNSVNSPLADLIPKITRPDGVVMTSPKFISPWYINCNRDTSTFTPFNGCMIGDYKVEWSSKNIFKSYNPNISLIANWDGIKWTIRNATPQAIISEPKNNDTFFVNEPIIFSFVCTNPENVSKQLFFGDSQQATTNNDFFMHQYDFNGNYSPTLLISDSTGNYTDSVNIKIKNYHKHIKPLPGVEPRSNLAGSATSAETEKNQNDCGFLGLKCFFSKLFGSFKSKENIAGQATLPKPGPLPTSTIVKTNVVDTIPEKGTMLSVYCDKITINPLYVNFEIYDPHNNMIFSNSLKCNSVFTIPSNVLSSLGEYKAIFNLNNQIKEDYFHVYDAEDYCS